MQRTFWGILVFVMGCLAGFSEELYFEGGVTSGELMKEIQELVHDAELNSESEYSWEVPSVRDFNQDGLPDVLYHIFFKGHGATDYAKLILEKGTLYGKNRVWRDWTADNVPPGADFIIGDWDSDGDEDIAYSLGDYPYVGVKLALFDGEEINEIIPEIHDYHYSVVVDNSYEGDFDGNGYLDILKSAGLTFLSENYKEFYCADYDIPKLYPDYFLYPYRAYVVTEDINRDGADDLIYWQYGKINTYFGNKNREHIFSASESYEMPIVANSLKKFPNGNGEDTAFYITSPTEFIWVTHDENGGLTFRPQQFTRPFNPSNVAAGDLNGDGLTDLLSWDGNRMLFYLGSGPGEFQYTQTISAPVQEIRYLFICDADRDNKKDVLLIDIHAAIATYYQRDRLSITPTPTPTPRTPTPVPPTPTPIPISPENIPVSEDMNLEDILMQAPAGAKVYLLAGKYKSATSPVSFPVYQNKDFTLIGIDPLNAPKILHIFPFRDSRITLQNLFFSRGYALPYGFIYSSNTDLTLIHCHIEGTKEYRSSYPGLHNPGDKTMYIQNSINKTVTFIDNHIEPGNLKTNLLVRNCQDTMLDFRENPMLGVENRIAHLQIEDCTNVKILLHKTVNPDAPRSLSGLSVYHSSVEVTGGVIRGYDGLPGVVGEDAGHGIVAHDGSSVVLDGTEVHGGSGGDGIERGADGRAVITDASSTVLWKSAASGWSLH